MLIILSWGGGGDHSSRNVEVVRCHLDMVRGDEQCDDDDEVSGSQQERGVQAGQVHDAADDNTRGGGGRVSLSKT